MVGYIGFDPGANSSVTRVRSTTSPTTPINHSDLDGSTSIYLPFDSDVNDDSSHGHTGQALGDATISSTQSKWGGNSLYLDGSDAVRYSTDDAMKLSTEDFTIEAWVYRTSNVSYGTVAARWDSAGNNRSYIARFDGHTPYFYYTTNGSSGSTVGRSFAGVTTSLNTWHHVAWVRRNGYLKFYLDGVESSSVYNMSGVNIFGASDSKFAVGAINSTTSATNYFAGYIDDLRIIKGKGLYSGAFTPPAAAVGVYNSYPVSLYLPFDSDIQDDSTHAHTVTASGDAAVSSAQSKFGGNSLALDGTGDYLSVSADTDFRTDDEFTLEGWARASSLSGFNTIIEQKSTDTTETFTLGIENNYLKATQVTTALSDWLFDTSFTGNNQQYSSDKRSITGSSGGLASAMNDAFINISVGETAYYVVEFTVQNLRNSNSFAVGWSANPSGFSRNGQTFNNPPPWGEHGSGTTIQIGLRPRPFLNTSRTFALGIKLTRDTSTTGSGEAYFFVNGVDETDSTTKTLSSAVANSFATNGFRFGAMVWDNNEWSIGPAGATSSYLSSYTTAMGGTPSLGVVTTASSTSITQTSGKTISTDEWFHYALGFNDGDVEIFHDGVKVSSGSSPTSSSAKAITIGASSSGENTFAGYLDDIRFSRVTRYTKNFVPPSAAVGATLNGTNETNTTTGFTSLYLPFDSDVNDDSDDPFTITASGGAAISSTQAKFGGNSLGLDGTNDYLTVSSSQSAMAFAGDFTIEYWMYPTGLDGDYQGPMGCHNSSGWLFQFNSSGGRFFINSGNIISTTAATSSNQWYHVAVTRRSGIVRLFIDGVQQGSNLSFSSAMPTNNDLIIGASNASGQNFAGYLDDIRIMDGYAKYTTEFSPPSSAVGTSVSETHNDLTILYMPFDDYLNDTARDHSVDQIGNVNVNTSVKKFGTGSAYFDGNNDALIVGAGSPDDFNLKNHDFTIELWAYLTSTATARLIHYGTGESYAPILFQSHSGSFRFYASKGGTWSPVNNALLGTVSLNTWTHLAATREGNTFRCFQDGVLKSTTVADYGVELMDATGSGITIGRYPSGIQSVPGYLDDIRIIKGKAIYTEAFTPPTEAVGPQVQGGGVTTTTRTVDKKELGSVWTLNRGSGQARGKSFINLRKRGRWRKSKLKINEGHRYREGTTESKVEYYAFTSPGEIPTGGFSNITRVDYLGVTAGGSGTTGGNRNWSPGSSGDSGTITAHLNQPGSPSSPISVTVGSAFPQTIDGPESAPDSPLTIPSAVQTAFNHYNITGGAAGAQGAGAKGGGPGGLGTPGPANGPGGAGGVSFAVLTSAHPDWTTHDNLTTPEISAVTADLGSPGSSSPHPGAGSYNSGGRGGGGGVGYGAGGGAGAGGAPPSPNPGPEGGNGGGGAGGAGSPGITLVRIQGTVFTASGGDGFSTSGGTQIESGGYKYHVFTSPGTFTMSGGTKDLEYLVVAGGGGGGGSSASDTGAGGGGGAGGLRQGTLPAVAVGSYPVTVGTGGAGTNGQGTAGNNSVFNGGGAFSTITAYGGGAGGSGYPQVAGGAGGSGGGGGGDHGPQPGGTATPGDGGNPGGTSAGPTGDNAGGGGGAGAAGENALGQNPTAGRKGGGGGAGAPYPAYAAPIIAPAIPSTAQSAIGPTGLYAGGGGGSTNQSPPAGYGGGPGGPGGGGRGNSPLNTQYGRGEDGVDGTGGGGGGANHQTAPRVGGDGGDGIVIIRYSTS